MDVIYCIRGDDCEWRPGKECRCWTYNHHRDIRLNFGRRNRLRDTRSAYRRYGYPVESEYPRRDESAIHDNRYLYERSHAGPHCIPEVDVR